MSSILQIANADRNLSAMMKYLKAADMEEALSGHGPFTILAPVNLAFRNLAPAYWDNLMEPNNCLQLTEVLSYLILTEKKLHRDFSNGQRLKTIHGKEVMVTVKDGEVRINGAKILSRDRQGSNGVVHSVDGMCTPLMTVS